MTAFPDLVHVERIAEALWRKSPFGNVTLMVGAGLSLNAHNIADPSRKMLTWKDLAENLCEKLYPSSDKLLTKQRDEALIQAHSTSGALRLAQQFVASFGRDELNQLLKTLLTDDGFEPSPLHADFLNLSWADIFTTNWDTLLEKANGANKYAVIRKISDISFARQPRIIKLHGSFPSYKPFIITEEDYRKYPADFAPFVNMVQQSMMERPFCLIGFSGDDPNFRHWIGWVRDNLREYTHPIYLVGWLELAPPQRKEFESLNIVPVDLSLLPGSDDWHTDKKHFLALDWFLKTLKDGPSNKDLGSQRPSQSISDPPARIAQEVDTEKLVYSHITGPGKEIERIEELRGQVSIWRNERENYEGWVVAPRRVRSVFWTYTEYWIGDVSRVIHLMLPWERLFTLREIIWRLDVSFTPLFNELIESVTQSLNDIDPNGRKCFKDGLELPWPKPDWAEAHNAWLEVAMALLRHYRLEGLANQFEMLALRIEKLRDSINLVDALTYQRTMFAIQCMDYTSARTMLPRWLVEDSDHIWAIRKAGILFELGDFDAAYELLTITLPAIRRSIRYDFNDYATLSCEGCAMQLIEIAELEKRYFGKDAQKEENKNGTKNPEWAARWKTLLANDCDIRDEWQTVCTLLETTPPDPRSNRKIRQRSFDLGQTSTSRHYGSGGQFLPAYQAIVFTEVAGMPPRISSGAGGVIVGSTGLKRASIWLKIIEPELAIRMLLRTCTSESDETLKAVATRETITQLKNGFAEEAVNILLQGSGCIGETISADKKQLDKLRVAMELLSRLTLRLTDPEEQKKVFNLAISLAHNLAVSGHLWLAGALSNLLTRVIECFDTQAQCDLILSLLKLPTEGIEERTFGGEPWWGDFSNLQEQQIRFHRDSQPEDWSEVVGRLLAESGKRGSRRRAVWRLTFLHCCKLLTESEQQTFAKSLWTTEFISTAGLPGQTDLYPWVFLDLPALEVGMAERLIRAKYLTIEGAAKVSLNDYLKEFGGIVNILRERKQLLALSPDEMSVITSKVIDWAKESYSPSSHPFADIDADKEIPKTIGVAKLLPFISIEEHEFPLIKSRFDLLENDQISCYRLYPPLIAKQPDLADPLISRLKTGIAGDDPDSSSNALHALAFWLSLAETGHANLPPNHLLEEVGLAIYLRREPVLAIALQFATLVFEKQPEVAIRTISDRALMGLDYLFNATRYDQAIESGLTERIDVPLVRYYCVKLAIAMTKIGYSDHPVLSRWIDDAKDDPLPEVRNQVATCCN